MHVISNHEIKFSKCYNKLLNNYSCHFFVIAGKSLYVTRMFQNFKASFPNATYLPVRLTESEVDIDCLIQTLCKRQSSVKEQDPVLLHIDTSAVCFYYTIFQCFAKLIHL